MDCVCILSSPYAFGANLHDFLTFLPHPPTFLYAKNTVIKAAIVGRISNLRLGLVGVKGAATTDNELGDLLVKSRWPWDQ